MGTTVQLWVARDQEGNPEQKTFLYTKEPRKLKTHFTPAEGKDSHWAEWHCTLGLKPGECRTAELEVF